MWNILFKISAIISIIAAVISSVKYINKKMESLKSSFLTRWISSIGRDFITWVITFLLMIVFFAINYYYYYSSYLSGFKFENQLENPGTFILFLYYSFLTITTLGSSSIIPTNTLTQIWAITEIILGYLMIAGLVSILATKYFKKNIKAERKKKEESTQNKNSYKKSNADDSTINKIYCSSTVFFAERVYKAFPGIRFTKWFSNKKEIYKRLQLLLEQPLDFDSSVGHKTTTDPIWWFRGITDSSITNFTKINKSHCKINYKLLNIKRMAIVRSDSYYRNFVYIETKPDSSILNYFSKKEIKENIESSQILSEEYAELGKKIFLREEYDDGYAFKNGKQIDLRDANFTQRFLTPYNFIIAAKFSPYNSEVFRQESNKYFDNILNRKIQFSEFISFMFSLSKHEQDD